MGGKEAAQVLSPGGLGIDIVRAAKNGHEDVGRGDLPGSAVDDRHRLAGKIDEQFLPGLVLLAEYHIGLLAPPPVALAELGVPETVGMLGLILKPEQLQGDPFAGQLPVHLLRIGLRTLDDGGRCRRIEAGIQGRLIHLLGRRPGDAGRLCPAHDVRHRVVGDGKRAADLPPGEAQLAQSQDLFDLAHG